MFKKWIYYSSLTFIIVFLSFGFTPAKDEYREWFHTSDDEGLTFEFPSPKPTDYQSSNIPFTGKYFIAYKEAIALKESQGRYRLVNTFGYMGKYQFGMSALRAIGIHDRSAFLSNPQLQEKAFVALLSKNKWELRHEIRKFEGKTVGGVKVTESGILAAAHLGGAASVKRFFRTAGKRYMRDGYGTSLRSYMKRFGGYDTSNIIADDHAKVK